MKNELKRLARLLRILRAHPGGLTEEELAEYSGLSPQVVAELLEKAAKIYDYTLCLSRITTARPEKGGGQKAVWRLEMGNYLPLLDLSPLELLILWSVLQAAPPELAAVREKVERLLWTPAHAETAAAQEIGCSFECGSEEFPIDNKLQSQNFQPINHELENEPEALGWQTLPPRLATAAAMQARVSPVFKTIRSALFRRNYLQIHYRAPGWPAAREITGIPLGMVLNADTGFWYLVMRRAGSPQDAVYHLDRIKKATVLPGRFKRPDFDLQQFMAPRWGMDMSPPVQVAVRFYNQARVLDKVRAELSRRGLPVPVPDADGSLLFKGEVYGVLSFFKWVLSFGSAAEIIEPPGLRERAIAVARWWAGMGEVVD
jgi:hypothetical protein